MDAIDTDRIGDILRDVARTEIMPRFRALAQGDIREKSPGNFVTAADEAAERALSARLSEALPEALVVGEEAVAADKGVLARLEGDRPVWVIDPVDGTYNFIHGRSAFGVIVALVQGGETQYGWLYDAPGGRMAHAVRGCGAFLDGRPVKIPAAKKTLKDMTGRTTGAQAWHFAALKAHVAALVNMRSSLFDYMSIVAGEADFILHVNTLYPWDHAAGVLIAQEAGAHVALANGAPYNPAACDALPMVTAPSRKAWGEVMAVLGERP